MLKHISEGRNLLAVKCKAIAQAALIIENFNAKKQIQRTMKGPTKPNKTTSATAADMVMTNPSTAKFIMDFFWPSGRVLDPCKGSGAFYDAIPAHCLPSWCEITKGVDFFEHLEAVDWIVTNPPYSIFDHFLKHSLKLAQNVVFFCPLAKAFKSKSIMDIVESSGFQLATVIDMGGGGHHGFNFGFPVGALHWMKVPQSRPQHLKAACNDIQFRRIQPAVVKSYGSLCGLCSLWNTDEFTCQESRMPDSKGKCSRFGEYI
jgi:hypothetical protein